MKNFDLKKENLYYVGGVVRDELLGRENFDVDIVCVGNAIDECSNLGEVVRTNPDFGTVKVNISGVEVDFASTRAETYPKAGHLPVVEKIGCTLQEDVLRRDFTINAMAKNLLSGEIIDYTGGLRDLENGLLRVLHEKSFIDDPTRILRALKFSVRFNFELAEETHRLQEEYLANINYDMCYKRIKKELIETFNLNSQKAFEKFFDEKIYKLVTKDEVQKPSFEVEKFVNELKASGMRFENLWLAYVGILGDLSHLELTKTEQKILFDFETLKQNSPKTDFELYKMLSTMLPETLVLYAIYGFKNAVKHYIYDLRDIKISINGKDLNALGLAPSPYYAEILDKVLIQKLKTPTMTRDEELQFAKKLILDL